MSFNKILLINTSNVFFAFMQGSAATYLRYGGICNDDFFVGNFVPSLAVTCPGILIVVSIYLFIIIRCVTCFVSWSCLICYVMVQCLVKNC